METDICTRIKQDCTVFDYLSIDRIAATHTGTGATSLKQDVGEGGRIWSRSEKQILESTGNQRTPENS